MSEAIEPFELRIEDAVLDDLRDRLARTRWPEAETVDDWSQGVPRQWLQDLCRHWADGYDWRRCEARLNGFGQFRTEVDGLGIHFLHVRSPEPNAAPLIMTHGWPGSVVEFLDVIGSLTDPVAHGGEAADAFHLVCPSLPGYGWSDRPATTGWGVDHTALAFAEIMARLGYDGYLAQGGDWGSAVSTALALNDPEHCAGIHLNMALAFPTGDMSADLTPEETTALEAAGEHQKMGTGYSKQQSTRPQTLGYGLVDSPVAQCAWITEKFWAWTDHPGDPLEVLDRDHVLDDVMHYWLPATGASSARLYWESFRQFGIRTVEAPVSVSIFPREIFRPSRRWCEAAYPDLRHFAELDRGGHFAAFEQPELFVDEVRAAFRTMR